MKKNLKPREVTPEILAAADRAFSRHLQQNQGRLANANPKDTGRMASSWRINTPNADPSVEPERDSPGGVTLKAYAGQIKMDGRWHLSNNVPYAQRVAYDPKWAKGGAGGSAWFTSIANASRGRLEEELRKEFRGQ